MNKAELKKVGEMKRQYFSHKCTADEIFNRSKAEYEALSECDKRRGDLRTLSGIITFGTGGRFANNRINQSNFWR